MMRFFIVFCLLTEISFAGELAKIGKKSVIVEMISEKEFGRDNRVCFYKSSKKFACGRVKKIKNNLALVTVKKSSLRKLIPGMIVKVKKGSTPDPLGISFYTATAYSPLSVFTNNIVRYDPASADPSSSTRWKVGTSKNSIGHSYFTIAGIFDDFHVGIQLPVSTMVPPYTAIYDYDSEDLSKYLSLTVSHKVFGLFTDYLFNFSKKKYDIFMGGGLGYISDKVTFEAFQLQDGTADKNEIIYGKSNLSILCLRVPALISYDLDPIKFIAGSTLILGLSGTPDTSGEVVDPSSTSRPGEFREFVEALSHKKKLLGLDFFAGVGMNF